MKFHDLFSMCLQNLKRQKSRTILTMLGVVVGVCSITIMVSLGIGLSEQSAKSMESMGDLRLIQVYGSFGESSAYSSGSPTGQGAKLTDESIEAFRTLNGVSAVTPKADTYELQKQFFAGTNRRYEQPWGTVYAMDLSTLGDFGYEVVEGELPGESKTVSKKNLPAVIGEYYEYSYTDSKRPEGYNQIYYSFDYGYEDPDQQPAENQAPYFDAMETGQVTMELKSDDQTKTETYTFKPAARLKGDWGKGMETVEGMVIDLETYKQILRDQARLNGKAATQDVSYSEALVKAETIDQVKDVEKAIQDLGFQTYSMNSFRESMEESSRFTQLMLGGIGAISLLVAAIGIANTMVMSITERTREIGIMKALGCRIQDIRLLFLMESGLIGLGGGLIGALVSVIISMIIDVTTSQVPVTDFQTFIQAVTGYGTRLSVIPPWLLLFGVGFAFLVGLVSGISPANRAVKISSLEAIRHE